MTTTAADLVLHNGLVTTLDRANPNATAVAVKDGLFLEVGTDRNVMALAGPDTKIIDLKGKRVLPGLIDNHSHIIRGGLNFNMELRWDGVRSLADAMEMLKRQVAMTPAAAMGPCRRRLHRAPVCRETPADNRRNQRRAPDTPVFLLHLYDRALLNAAALRVVGYTRDTPCPRW